MCELRCTAVFGGSLITMNPRCRALALILVFLHPCCWVYFWLVTARSCAYPVMSTGCRAPAMPQRGHWVVCEAMLHNPCCQLRLFPYVPCAPVLACGSEENGGVEGRVCFVWVRPSHWASCAEGSCFPAFLPTPSIVLHSALCGSVIQPQTPVRPPLCP